MSKYLHKKLLLMEIFHLGVLNLTLGSLGSKLWYHSALASFEYHRNHIVTLSQGVPPITHMGTWVIDIHSLSKTGKDKATLSKWNTWVRCRAAEAAATADVSGPFRPRSGDKEPCFPAKPRSTSGSGRTTTTTTTLAASTGLTTFWKRNNPYRSPFESRCHYELTETN